MEPEDTYVLCLWNDGDLILMGKEGTKRPMTRDQARLLALECLNSSWQGSLRVFLCRPDFSAEPTFDHIWEHKALQLEEIA